MYAKAGRGTISSRDSIVKGQYRQGTVSSRDSIVKGQYRQGTVSSRDSIVKGQYRQGTVGMDLCVIFVDCFCSLVFDA